MNVQLKRKKVKSTVKQLMVQIQELQDTVHPKNVSELILPARKNRIRIM